MKTRLYVTTLCGCALLIAALPSECGAQAAAAPQAAPAAQAPQGICGGQATCYESNDFAVTITDFRVSTAGGWKLIDTTLHFQNKTNQPLTLGYTDGSAMAIDDQGNRFGLSGQANAVRGIGRVSGNNNIDPKFSLQPGGAGDTMFELAWAPGNATQGVNYEMDLSIREINALEGHQFALAGEVPLQFKGLANGVAGAAPAAAAGGRAPASGVTNFLSSGSAAGAQPVCNPATGLGNTASTLAGKAGSLTGQANSAAGQKVSSSANSAVSSASSTANSAMANLSSLKSMFGRKKAAAAPAATTAAVANPCPPAASSATPVASNALVTGSTATPVVSPASATSPAPQALKAVRTTAVTKTVTQPTKAASTTTATKTAATKAPAKKQAPAPVVQANP